MSVTHFIDAYKGKPPWDIGRPQPSFKALADAGEIAGPVLDAGCGTGENALFLAARGFAVVGVDAVEAAVEAARRKALARGLEAEFLVHDALALDGLGRRFATVVDSGLFHTFDDRERSRFVKSLAAALTLGGHYYVLCFSEREVRDGGPRRVTQAELRAAFDQPPFHVLSIEAAEMAANLDGGGRQAWLARIERAANP
ncbi:MAG: class I SAM-dependent methyltransferase [Actinobacteria bacterium]|nr:class I SAM-dependent methyltransferase [Actinomycetota bacterium]